jgi:serine/threonine protein kinase
MYRSLIDIAAGMDYLHSLGVINGDLKPANVLLKSTTADVRGFTCKVCSPLPACKLLAGTSCSVCGCGCVGVYASVWGWGGG